MTADVDPVRSSTTLGMSRVAGILLELATVAYLMRTLGPEPFGIVAMVTSLTALLGAVGDAGVGSSLVSDASASQRRVGAAFLTCCLLGVCMAVVILVTTPAVVAFYGTHQVAPVWLATGLLIPVANLQSIPRSLAQRAQRFGVLAWLPLVAGVLASIVGVAVAQYRQDYWPILARQGVTVVLGGLLLWIAIRPRLSWPGGGDMREVLRFGGGVLAFDLLNTLNRNADKFLMGRYLGSEAVGLYTLAYRVLSLPLTTLGSTVGTVAYPRLSLLMPDTQAVARELARIMRAVAWVATPICLTTALVAPELVEVLAGRGWTEAILPFRVLAVLGVYQTPFAQVGLAYIVSRRTALMARWALVATPVLVGSFVFGLKWGISGVAVSYAAMSLALAPALLWYAGSALDCSPWILGRSPLLGILEGTLYALPVAAAAVGARAAGCAAPWVQCACLVVGAAMELLVLRRLRRTFAATVMGDAVRVGGRDG